MLVTKWVGDKFWMLVTSHVTNIKSLAPTSKIGHQHKTLKLSLKSVTNLMSPTSLSPWNFVDFGFERDWTVQVLPCGLIYLRRSFGTNEIKSFLWKPRLVRLVILIPIFHITLSYHELPLLTIIRLVLPAFNSIFARFYQAHQPAFHQAEPHFTTFNRII